MYGRHRNGLGIDPETGTGTVIGSDGKEYEIGPRADLRGADLRYADLFFANLTDADLVGANLAGANLSGAELKGANLTDANLEGADLSFAGLDDADLTGAYLVGAHLLGATVDPHHVPLIEAAHRETISSLKVNGRTSAPGYGRTSATGRKVMSPGRKVISPDLTGVNAAEAAEREYAMGDEETAVGIVPVHIYSDGKRVYFFSDAVDANEFLETLPPSIKSRAKIGNDFSSTTVTLYPPGRAPNPGYGHRHGYGRRR